MSASQISQLPDDVVRADVQSERGTFAAVTCRPHDSSLPRGNVLLIPGFTGSKEDFAALLPLLAEAAWSAASYDQRGQFETPAPPDADFSLAGFAADALAVAGALHGTAEQVHLVGHSFGGLVAAAAALAEPRRWASLTLLCSGPGGFAGEQRSALLEGVELLQGQGPDAAYQHKSRRDLERGKPAPEPQVERWLHSRFLANSPGSLAAIGRLLAETPDMTTALVGLDLPVWVVRGENDDAWSHAVQAELAEALGSSVVVIDGAAHSPAREQPEATRDALARLWMR